MEYELGDLSPSEVVTGLQTIGFKVHDLLYAEDGVIKLIISYKRKLSNWLSESIVFRFISN